MNKRGYTLTEVLIAVILVAILAAMAIPNYRRTIETQRWNTARDSLLAIYAGEQVYASLHGGDYFATNSAASMDTWRDNLHMDNPALDATVTYTINVDNTDNPPTFTASAIRTATSISAAVTLTIDQDRNFGGTWNP
jgi:prepilin-type N-terminal cleavage/methylation domain-containing protein